MKIVSENQFSGKTYFYTIASRRALPAGAVVAYYNGPRIEHGEMYSTNSDSNYEIYVDWDFTDKSAWIDIPLECVDLEDYSASLAHKANHGFDPNVQFVSATHPRFGRVPAIKTVRLGVGSGYCMKPKNRIRPGLERKIKHTKQKILISGRE